LIHRTCHGEIQWRIDIERNIWGGRWNVREDGILCDGVGNLPQLTSDGSGLGHPSEETDYHGQLQAQCDSRRMYFDAEDLHP
jgi:hypothetical protein